MRCSGHQLHGGRRRRSAGIHVIDGHRAPLGNALDNAIEASRRVDDPAKRLIKLALFRQGQMVVIRVDNWFDGRLNTDAGGRLTTIKPDTVRHGWGVKSIQWTARKYGGQAVTDVADHWFTLTVLLPSTNAQEDE